MFANRNPKGFEIMKYFIWKGANVNSVNYNGESVVHFLYASEFIKEKLIYLLEQGANPNLVDKFQNTPFNY